MNAANQKSIRTEFDELKQEFKSLSASGGVSKEVRVLFTAMITLFEVIMAIFMEKTTKKNSKNSSIPSSQTEKDESYLNHISEKQRARVQKNIQPPNTRTKTSVKKIQVTQCDSCGEDLSNTACESHQRRTLIDIVFEKTVCHYEAEVKTCKKCGDKTKGKFPAGISGELQYGIGFKAFILDMLVAQMMSLNRLQKLLQTIVNQLISEATMLKYVLQLNMALESWEKETIEDLKGQKVIHVDETSMRVDKKNQWIHVYSYNDITLKVLHSKRGQEAMECIGIIPEFEGKLVHDCYSSYMGYEHCEHQLCGSHLLRELEFIIQSNGYSWAKNIKSLLQQTCRKVTKSKKKRLSENEYLSVRRRLRNLITRGEKQLPILPPKPKGKRGKVPKPKAHNLLERIKDNQEAVLLFARDPNVSFTNNRAERDLRMAKVKQKVSGCFRKEKFAKAYCRISSYLQTMQALGVNPLVAIHSALTKYPFWEKEGE